MRVADPSRVGNALARYGTPVENLEGYPGLENYVRYVIQSPMSNDRLLSAFERMPSEYYRMDDIDDRSVMFHRPAATEMKPERSGKNSRLAGIDKARAGLAEVEKI
jgi:hypothetical protein